MSDPAQFVELGLPVPPGRKFRSLNRLVAKIVWPILRIQVLFNRSSVEQFRLLQERVDKLETKMSTVVSDLLHHSSVLTRHEGFGVANERLTERIELAQRQAFARVTDSTALLERRLIDLSIQNASNIEQARDDQQRESQVFIERAQEYVDARVLQLDTSVAETRHFVDQLLAETRLFVNNSVAEVRQRLGGIDVLLDGVRSEMPLPTPRALKASPRLDLLYGALEDTFRGPRDLVRERLRIYVDELAAVAKERPVLDVGCGRGDLLELLRERGVPAYGIEINSSYQEIWTEGDLDVRVIDINDHLRTLEPGSLSAVTAIHVVEHLGIETLLNFLDLALIALAPGGLLILETPNPENLTVGATRFYLDPSHVSPVPAALLAFLVRSRGFGDAQVRYLDRGEPKLPKSPVEREWSSDLEPFQEVIDQYLFAPYDYAVVARRI